MKRIHELLTRRPSLVLAFLAAATVPFVWGATRTRIANPLDGWFVRGDPVLAEYRSYQERFGNDEVVLVAVHSPDGIFVLPMLERVASLTRALRQVQHVRSVLSLSTVPVVQPEGEELRAHELGTLLQLDRVSPVIIRARLRQDAVSWRRLVSRDEKTTLLYVIQDVLEDDSVRTSILAEIRRVLARELGETGVEYRIAGYGVIYDAVNEASARDLSRVLLPAAAVCTVLLFLALRSFLRVLVGLLAAGVATIWAVGLFGFTATPINLVTTMVPTIVAVISLANAIHLLRDVPASDGDSSDSSPFSPVVKACLFSSLTSAAAFLALTVSDIQVLRELGGFTAAGLLASFVVSALICIPLGSCLRRRFPLPERNRVGTWLEQVGKRIIRRRGIVLALLTMALLAAFLGHRHLRIDTHSIGFLPAEHPVRLDSGWIEEHYGYYTPIEFELVGEEGAFAEPDMLRKVLAFQTALESHEDMEGVHALPDLFLSGAEADGPTIPGDAAGIRASVEGLRAALGSETVDRLVGPAYGRTHVAGRIRMQSASGLAAVAEEALRRGREVFDGEIEIKNVGYLPLYVSLTRHLATSFLKSLPLVVGLNFLLLLLLRSFRWALLGTPSNILPVCLLLGAMGWMDIPLDVATVSIACIAFGILVDDTIHLLVQCRRRIKEGSSRRQAALKALNEGGSAITWTTVVLVGGFTTFLGAEVVPVRYFGSLLSLTLLVGLICDIVLVPVVVSFRSRD